MIKTERLIIRHFNESDREALIPLLMNDEFMEFSADGVLNHEAANHRFDQILRYTTENFGKRALILIESGELAGYCGVEPFPLNGCSEYEFGFRLASDQRGRGIAAEAAKAILATSHINNLYAYVEKGNTKSINVLRKVGFISHGSCVVDSKSYRLFRYSIEAVSSSLAWGGLAKGVTRRCHLIRADSQVGIIIKTQSIKNKI